MSFSSLLELSAVRVQLQLRLARRQLALRGVYSFSSGFCIGRAQLQTASASRPSASPDHRQRAKSSSDFDQPDAARQARRMEKSSMLPLANAALSLFGPKTTAGKASARHMAVMSWISTSFYTFYFLTVFMTPFRQPYDKTPIAAEFVTLYAPSNNQYHVAKTAPRFPKDDPRDVILWLDQRGRQARIVMTATRLRA